MASTTLPQPRAFLTSLFNCLPNDPKAPTDDPPASLISPPTNPLLTASPATKTLFLTLHCLFPTEFLPALDLLDRRLVTRLGYHTGPSIDVLNSNNIGWSTNANTETNSPDSPVGPTTDAPDQPTNFRSNLNQVYYVRSSHSRPSSRSRYHGSTSTTATSYEVRLSAWHCTCAAFTFSAFTSTLSLRDDAGVAFGGAVGDGERFEEGGDGERGGRTGEWRFGGLTRERGAAPTPVCKHLLACVLVERCAELEAYVEERVVGNGEMAGWGAGWGG
ncbi:hypothetical protein MMC30_007248 [Trapelia coarctata]|nr:hypothetical protein [Trapelia coarctata]